MICEQCHTNEATFHRVQVTNGVRSETHICAQCLASAQGALNMGSLLAQLFAPVEFVVPQEQLKCSRCGATPAQFRKTGRLGCEHCYTDLNRMVEPLLKRVQGRVRHVGRVPHGFKQSPPADPVLELRKQIAAAVAKEDYETAAQLRDEIRSLEGGAV